MSKRSISNNIGTEFFSHMTEWNSKWLNVYKNGHDDELDWVCHIKLRFYFNLTLKWADLFRMITDLIYLFSVKNVSDILDYVKDSLFPRKIMKVFVSSIFLLKIE